MSATGVFHLGVTALTETCQQHINNTANHAVSSTDCNTTRFLSHKILKLHKTTQQETLQTPDHKVQYAAAQKLFVSRVGTCYSHTVKSENTDTLLHFNNSTELL